MGYVLGVSVGQKSDHSAIVIAEYPHRSGSGWVYLSSMESEDVEKREAWRWPRPTIAGDDWALNIVHVERWLRGTPYPTIVADVDRLSRAITLDGRIRAHLLIDSTGVGQPIVALFYRQGLRVVSCTITGGTETSWTSKRAVNAPKRDVVMSAVAMLDVGRLRWPNSGDTVQTMERELRNFQMRYSRNGPEMFELERREHDDIVLSLAMTTWVLSIVGPRNPLHVSPPRPRSAVVPTNWW